MKAGKIMFNKIRWVVFGVVLVLFSGCVSQNKYREVESELNLTRTQIEQEKISASDLLFQNEKLEMENERLLESIEDCRLNLEKENSANASADSTNPESDTWMDETPRPWAILLSSCQQQESIQKVLSRYEAIDPEPYVVKVDLGAKGSWWRIYCGHYETRESAIIEMNRYGFTDKIVLNITDVRRTDVDFGQDAADIEMSLLMKNELDPEQ
jgi:hypothetical protein